MSTQRWAPSTSVVNGIIYAIGGAIQGVAYLSTVHAYDPATDTWTKKADMPTARFYFSTSAVNGKIYVIGGGSSSLLLQLFQRGYAVPQIPLARFSGCDY